MGGCCCRSSNSEFGGIDIFYQSNPDIQSVSSFSVGSIGLELTKTPSWLSFEDEEELDKNVYLNDNCFTA